MFNLFRWWRLRRHPREDYRKDYETLVRMARRCAYDLAHTVDALPAGHFYLTELDMRERSNWWVACFTKGNPGKDYRLTLERDRGGMERQLNDLHAWCKEHGLEPPDNRDIPF
jgi:hypothetical protein